LNLRNQLPFAVHVLVDVEEGEVSFLEEVFGLPGSLEEVGFMSLEDLGLSFVEITPQFLLGLLRIF